jgi:Domain of unknown function (DUF6371)/Zinc beta-ribbon finger, putative
MEYPFELQKYTGPASRHACPQCGHRREFSRYVDVEGDYIADHVGRCNRVDKCGYHFKPKDYFTENPTTKEYKPIPQPKKQPPSYFPFEDMKRTRTAYQYNNFAQWLLSICGARKASELIAAYHLGTSRRWPGANIFWQIDADFKIRTGKIMLYNRESGRRSKSHYSFAHKNVEGEYNLKQCLYGLHLMTERAHDPIAVVESEKTAMVASAYLPEYIWMATGGGTNNGLCEAINGKNVTLFPDLGVYDRWKNYGDSMGFATSDILESHADSKDREEGYDIADFLLRYELSGFQERRAQLFRAQWKVEVNEVPQPEPKVRPPQPTENYFENLKDGRQILMSPKGYPADWDIPKQEISELERLKQKNPAIIEMVDRLGLEPAELPEGARIKSLDYPDDHRYAAYFKKTREALWK